VRSRFAARAAKKNRRAQLLARAPRISPTIEAAFVAAVRRQLRAYHDVIRNAYTPQMRQDDFASAYQTLAQKAKQFSEAFTATAFAMAKRLEKFSKSEAIRTLGDIASDLPSDVAGFAEQFAADAVEKLRGLMDRTLDDVEEAAPLIVGEEIRTSTLENILEGWISRGINSARNMVTQGTAQLNQERQKEAGIDTYVWLAMHDDKTRPEHAALDGQEHSYDDPPLTDSDIGIPCNPGDDYNCRCLASPVIRIVAQAADEEEAAA